MNTNEKLIFDYMVSNGEDYDDRKTIHSDDIFIPNLSKSQIKGYLSDLYKKGLIIDCELPNGIKGWQVL